MAHKTKKNLCVKTIHLYRKTDYFSVLFLYIEKYVFVFLQKIQYGVFYNRNDARLFSCRKK